mmetsp:Transcript_3026/g.11268  ORF Transcript_3026/g.11268 Transcript_3026/m.11268 type:complete len:911 (+) Transcript_3026:148-2880(+)
MRAASPPAGRRHQISATGFRPPVSEERDRGAPHPPKKFKKFTDTFIRARARCARLRDAGLAAHLPGVEGDAVPGEHGDLTRGVDVHDARRTLADVTVEHLLGEVVLEEAHHRAAQGAGTVGGVEALVDESVLEPVGDVESDLLLLEALEHLVEHDLGNLAHLVLVELAEDDDLVEAVEELGAEVVLELLVDELLDALVGGVLGVVVELEAEAAAALLDDGGADVGGEDDEGVLEVDHATLGVGEAAILKNLKHHVEDVGVRLLNLVKEHEGVRAPPDSLGELATLGVADVAGGRADELGHGVPLHELGHVEAHHRILGAEVEGGDRLGELGLTDAGGSREDEGRDGAVGVLETRARAANGAGAGDDSLLLADEARVKRLLHVHELVALVRGHLLDRDAGPRRDNLGDVRLGDGGSSLAAASFERRLVLLLLRLGDLLDLRLELYLLVAEGTRSLKVLRANRGVLLLEQSLELLVELLGLLGERRVRQANAGASLVDEIDRLVGEEPVGDVLVRKLGGSLDRLVGVPQLVVGLVPLAEALEDENRLLDGGLGNLHGLETTLERGVLLDVLAVLVDGGGADALELTAGEGGLEDVSRVDGALRRAGANERVHLVDEEDDILVSLDLVHELLEALLELTAVLGARDEEAHVQGHHALALERLGDVVGGDLLREALRNGGLTDAGLADEAGVVLGAAAENLGDADDLVRSADARVELGLLSLLGEVGAELLEGWRLGATRGATRAGGGADSLLGLANHADHLRANLGGIRVEVLEHASGDALALAEEAEEEVLRADVVVAELPRLLERQLQDALGAGGEGDLHGDEAGAAADDLLNLDARLLEGDAHALEHLGGDAGALADETEHDLLGADEVVAEAAGLLLGQHDNLDGLLGEALEHGLDDETTATAGATSQP